MSYYKVCSLIIKADKLPKPFASFEIPAETLSEDNRPADDTPSDNRLTEDIPANDIPADRGSIDNKAFDMELVISDQPLSPSSAVQIHEKVSDFNIYAMPDGSWIYEYRADGSLLWTDAAYTKMVTAPFAAEARYAISHLLSLPIRCRLISNGIITLHAACIAKDGKAVAFTAASGTGKSTRANLWIDHLGYSWISGDRPCLDVKSGLVHGAPWDGKEQIWTPSSAAMNAVCEIVRSEETKRDVLAEKEAFAVLAKQLFVPMWDSTLGATALALLKKLIRTNRIYRLYCDMTEQSAAEAEKLIFDPLRS